MSDEERFLRQAIELAYANIEKGGRPFGAVVVKDGAAIATGVNEVHATNDPTDHAEMVAIRAASRALGSASLDGCTVYASGQPCPMCMAALRVAGPAQVAVCLAACAEQQRDQQEQHGDQKQVVAEDAGEDQQQPAAQGSRYQANPGRGKAPVGEQKCKQHQ